MRITALIIIFFVTLVSCTKQIRIDEEKQKEFKFGVFSFTKEVILPGTPNQIFSFATGDISGWWDHSFSENPKKFFIEPKPGGGFWEIFDDDGNGVLHATVIGVEKNKFLRMDGPLGLAGRALKMVMTYNFEAVGKDSTKFSVDVHASGEMDGSTGKIVSQVWDHFVFERFKPFVEGKLE